MDSKFLDLVAAIDIELKRAEKVYKDVRKTAQEVAASAALSPSQSGDRYHSQGAADMARQKYTEVLALKKEIELKKDDICFTLNGEQVFLVDNPIFIKDFKLISTKSPIGQSLLHGKNS